MQKMRSATFAIVAVLGAVAACKKKPPPAPNAAANAPSASPSTSSVASAGPTIGGLERFVDARPAPNGIEIAALARDRTLISATLDDALHPTRFDVLAREVEALEGTDIALSDGGLIVATVKIGGERGTWLVRKGSAPRAIGAERCELADGFAWLSRDGGNAKLHVARASGELESATFSVAADREAHVACGPHDVAVTARDGENLSLGVANAAGTTLAAPVLVEAEKEGELEDELRERFVLPRAHGAVALLRVGTGSVAVREVAGGAPSAWKKAVVKGGKALPMSEDADVVEAAASPDENGPIFLLVSVPVAGSTCSDGDPPRKIVLHTIAPKDGLVTTTRPVIELPCGVEAIAAHLTAEGDHARMWWTEPVDAKTCNQPGLSIAAVVTASSEGGAKRMPILAEGVTPIGGKFLAVVRPQGCVPYATPGNGSLVWVTSH